MAGSPALDPDVKPPEFRVPRGRSGHGSESALATLLSDLERVRKAKEAYGELAMRSQQSTPPRIITKPSEPRKR